jgi:hypothetical protein
MTHNTTIKAIVSNASSLLKVATPYLGGFAQKVEIA